MENIYCGVENKLNANIPVNVVQNEIELSKAIKTFQIAQDGGKHCGFLKNNLERPSEDLIKGIGNLEKQIKLHQDKISNPAAHVANWINLDPRQKEALITKKWPSDIERQIEQRDILKILLRERK